MVVHQHEGDNVNFEAIGHSPDYLEEGVAVVIGKENSLLIIATRQDVVVCTFVFDSQGTCHERPIFHGGDKVKYNQ